MTDGARSDRLVRALAAALLTLGLYAGGCGAWAQSAATKATDGPAWSALTPAQQSALQPLKRDWPGIDAPRKQKWLEIAARMPSMSPDDRQRVQQRMAEWARLSPEERGLARLQFQEARQLSPQQRQSRWDAYMALPAEERRALAESARTVPRVKQPPGQEAVGGAAPAARKNSVAGAPAAASPKAVAPTLVQAKPGASTTLISNTVTPPAHAQAGQPKIAASQDVVNRRTLLPKAGPQAPAPAAAASSGQ